MREMGQTTEKEREILPRSSQAITPGNGSRAGRRAAAAEYRVAQRKSRLGCEYLGIPHQDKGKQPARNSYNTLLRPNLDPAVKTLAMREMLPLDTSDKLHLVNMAASQLGKKGSATVC